MNYAFSKIWIVIILALFVVGGVLSWQYFRTLKKEVGAPGVKLGLNLKTTKLATISEGYESPYETTFNPAVFTADGKQAIYIGKKGEKYFVFVNNKKSGPYDNISSLLPIVSPDGRRIAYIAEKEDKQCIVVNGKEGKLYDHILEPKSIYPSNIVFSPNSKHIAYIASEKDKGMFVVVDNKESRAYDDIFPLLVFSPNSERIAYIAKKNNKIFVVIDGKEYEAYDNFDSLHWYLSLTHKKLPLVFSPDSKHFAYIKIKEGKVSVVMDGKESEFYDYILPPVFSPDSKHFAYAVKKNDGGTMIIFDGKEAIKDGKNFAFSPNSKHFAYWKQKNQEEKARVVLNDKEIGSYDFVDNLIFSPDSKKIAYIAYEKGKMFAIVNSKKIGKGYNFIYGKSLNFSPDSKHLAYIASNKAISPQRLNENIKRMNAIPNAFVVIDGKENKEYNAIFVSPFAFTFSPNSKRFAYIATDTKGMFVVLDNKEGEQYFLISPNSFVFSNNSKHFAYSAQLKEEKGFSIVVDGRESKIYDWIGNSVFSSDSKYITYGAKVGNEFWWVVKEVK